MCCLPAEPGQLDEHAQLLRVFQDDLSTTTRRGPNGSPRAIRGMHAFATLRGVKMLEYLEKFFETVCRATVEMATV